MDNLTNEGLSKLSKTPVVLAISGLEAMVLIGQLQLALGHPANKGNTADAAMKLAKQLQQVISGIDADVDRVIEQGWHSKFDN